MKVDTSELLFSMTLVVEGHTLSFKVDEVRVTNGWASALVGIEAKLSSGEVVRSDRLPIIVPERATPIHFAAAVMSQLERLTDLPDEPETAPVSYASEN